MQDIATKLLFLVVFVKKLNVFLWNEDGEASRCLIPDRSHDHSL